MKKYFVCIMISSLIFCLNNSSANAWHKKKTLSAKTEALGIKKESKTRIFLRAVKGKPVANSIEGGMWSFHTKPNSDYNGVNNMIGLEFKGVTAGTFKNSFEQQTYYVGVARDLYKKNITKNLDFDIKYKAGFMHGYGDRYPNLCGVTPLVLPVVGATYRGVGADVFIIPSNYPIFAVNLRINLPHIKRRSKKTI